MAGQDVVRHLAVGQFGVRRLGDMLTRARVRSVCTASGGFNSVVAEVSCGPAPDWRCVAAGAVGV